MMATKSGGSEAPPPNDLDEFHRLVGLAIRGWARVESELWTIVSGLLQVDDTRARIVMSAIRGTRAKREFIVHLAKVYVLPDRLKEFSGLMGRYSSLSKTRNALAHHQMHTSPNGQTNQFIDQEVTENGLIVRIESYPLSDLRVFVKAVDTLRLELLVFCHASGPFASVKPRMGPAKVPGRKSGNE